MASRAAKANVIPWENRIVGWGEEDADQLLANPRNFRIHPKAQQDALTGSLNQLRGFIQPVVVNRLSGHVVDGHLRISLAITKGEKVPVAYVELTDEEERLALLSLDPIAALAGQDDNILQSLLSDTDTSDENLRKFLDQLGDEGSLPIPSGNQKLDLPDGPLEETQHVRQVQLFVSIGEYAEFEEMLGKLAIHFGAKTVTDTAVAAVKHAYNSLIDSTA